MDNYTATELAYKNGYEQGMKDALKEQEKLESKLRVLESSGWISTSDALPGEGVKVLGYNTESGLYCVGSYSKKWGKWRAAGSPKVTHWLPLPVPPKEE